MSKPFKFKEFSVNQDKCAMKIGTDGVLLGAWISITHNPFSILDVGTGTGILALMLAQRSHAEVIEALEIDDHAYEQAVENFENAIWNDRLFCYHAGFNEFVEEIDEKYDLIMANPPFYKPSKPLQEDENESNNARKKARFYDALPFEHLLFGTAKLLSENGQASFIIPYPEEKHFITIAEKVGLFPNRITRVKGTPNTEIKRSLLELSFKKSSAEVSELIIETSRHQYTPEYISLTKQFYLKM